MAESRKIDEPVTFSTFLLFSCFFSSLRVLSENENESDLILFVSSEKLLSFDFFYPGKSIYGKGSPFFKSGLFKRALPVWRGWGVGGE